MVHSKPSCLYRTAQTGTAPFRTDQKACNVPWEPAQRRLLHWLTRNTEPEVARDRKSWRALRETVPGRLGDNGFQWPPGEPGVSRPRGRRTYGVFAEHGFPPSEFLRLAIGPVVRKDELEYFREIGLHETVTVTYAALGLSADAARFVIENEVWSERGERAATIRSTGGWLDLRARKLVIPPPELVHAMRQVPRAPDFAELSSTRQ
jgi:acyl-CoA thioester hydrolase